MGFLSFLASKPRASPKDLKVFLMKRTTEFQWRRLIWNASAPQLSKFPDPTQDECVIFQIGLCFRASNECDLQRWLFALNSNLKIAADHFMAFLFDDERSLIEAFLQQINCLDPDVLLTFNGSKFDWPYLASRCRKNGLSLNVLSRLSHALVSVRPVGPKNLRIVSIPGRAVLDVFQFLRLFHSVDESSYSLSLDSASKRWLSSNCWKLDVPFWNIFLAFTTEDSKVWNEVASYCVRDCESCLALFDELNVWKRTRSLCNVFRCSLDEILVRSPGMLTWKLLRQLGFSNQWWVKFRPSRKMYPNSFCWTVGLRFRPGLYHNVGVESTTAFFNQTIFERSLDKENDDDDLLKQAVEYLQSSKESTIALKTFYTGLVRDVLSRSAASELIELRNRKIAQKFESRFVFATENFVFFYSSQEADSKYSSFCVFSKTKAVGLARDQNRVVYYGIWFPFLLAKLVCDSCLQLFLQGSSEEEIRKTFEQVFQREKKIKNVLVRKNMETMVYCSSPKKGLVPFQLDDTSIRIDWSLYRQKIVSILKGVLAVKGFSLVDEEVVISSPCRCSDDEHSDD
ncbi:DNA polymerase delta catalytic subunit [Galdieria sulphuraria]|nr:DNA polymerase delta catalytic subunit [Galdieria sulphuraria]